MYFIQGCAGIQPADSSRVHFSHLLRDAVEHESENNQSSPTGDEHYNAPVVLPTVVLRSRKATSSSQTPHLSPTNSFALPILPSSSVNIAEIDSANTSAPSERTSAKRHANEGKKNARKRRREAKKGAQSNDALDYDVRRSAGRQFVNDAQDIQTSARVETMPVAAGAYVAKKAEAHEIQAEHVSIDDLRSSKDWKYIEHQPTYARYLHNRTRLI